MLLLAGSLPAQHVISARSGMVHFKTGEVSLTLADGEPAPPLAIDARRGEFPMIPEYGSLETGRGKAEILLTPGAFLRVNANSRVRLIRNELDDTRLVLEKGEFLLEVAEYDKRNRLILWVGDRSIEVADDGLYALALDPAVVRVYDGKLRVAADDRIVEVKKGRVLAFDGSAQPEKFDRKETDSFYAWSQNRAEYIARANVASARSMMDNRSWRSYRSSGWMFNPWTGMVTFLPARGIIYSPFGWSFWSPNAFYHNVYRPPIPMRDPRAGSGSPPYRTASPTPQGTSGTIANSGGTGASGAARTSPSGQAPIPRSGGQGGGRTR
jgi:hypothetical protein